MSAFLQRWAGPLLFVGLPLLLSAWLWDSIPDTVPIHWNAQGEADGYGPKALGLLLWPAMAAGIYLLMWWIPRADPKRRGEETEKAARRFADLFGLWFFLMFLATLAAYLGAGVDVARLVMAGVWGLFIVIGLMLPTLPPSYFMGIRTPWTLEDDEIWRRTHLVSGWLWLLVGILMLVLTFVLPQEMSVWALLLAVAVLVAVPFGYSYYLWLQDRKEPSSD